MRCSSPLRKAARSTTAPRAAAAPRGKAPARKSPPAKKGKKTADDQYQPYRKANAAQKQLRTRNFTLQVRRFFSSENPVVKLFHREDPAVFGEKASTDPNEARKAKRAAQKEKRRRQAQRWNMQQLLHEYVHLQNSCSEQYNPLRLRNCYPL